MKNNYNKGETKIEKQKQFTFYDLYWKLIKQEKDNIAGWFIKAACAYMFTDGPIEPPQDDKQDFIWSITEEYLRKTKTKETEGKPPKTFNAKFAHFAFDESYYKAIKLMTDEQSGT